MPNSVTSIGSYAFSACSGLTSITIPSKVRAISDYTFNGCNNLTTINIPDSVRTIGTSAFRYCQSLISITIPDKVTTLGQSAFENTGLTSIYIPQSVTSIGQKAFYDCSNLTSVTFEGLPNENSRIDVNGYLFKNCSSLREVIVLAHFIILTNSSSSFSNIPDSVVLKVPCTRLDAYVNSSTWGTYFTNIVGICDSVDTTIYDIICAGETYNDYGFIATGAGTYFDTLQAANNSDSIVMLILTLSQPSSGTDTIEACDSLIWIDGITYTESTDSAIYTLTNAAGCDSVVTLHLTIKHSSNTIDTYEVCDSLTWIDGITYYETTNTPTYIYTAANGCDSIITLNLTINSYHITDTVVACDSYTWIDGITYTESTDSPTQTYTALNGCDSIITLNLTINHSVYDIVVDTAINEYVWNDTTYTESGIYEYRGTTAEGCDSVITLMLTIQEVGIESANALSNLTFYPNPTSATITFNRTDIKKIEVLDAVGRTAAVYENSHIIDLSKLSKGYYTMRITTDRGVAIRKVIRN